MSSLNRQVTNQRNLILERRSGIYQRRQNLRSRLEKVGLALEKFEWRDGGVSVQVNVRLGMLLFVAGLGALIFLSSERPS